MYINRFRLFTVFAILFVVIAAPTVSAADITVDKTATKTGEDTATVTLTVNGPGTANSGADVVFSIDSSGSMSDTDPTNLRQTAAKSFVDKMDPSKDQAGVVSWDDEVDFTQPLTNDFTLVKQQIDNVDSSGGTNINYGMSAAINLLDTGKKAGNTPVIILMTDGDSWGYIPPGSPGSYVDEAVSKGYKIYTIGLGQGIDSTALQQIATTTGGQYYFASDASALDPIFNQIYSQVTTTLNNVVVTDVLPSYIELVGNPTVPLTSSVKNADGTTTLTWNIGTIKTGDKWTASFNVRSSQSGNLPTNVYGASKVTFNDPAGAPQSAVFPEVKVNFEAVNAVNAATVGMQETGVPVTGLVMALLMVFAGLSVSKRK